jgi:hypothetical protein
LRGSEASNLAAAEPLIQLRAELECPDRTAGRIKYLKGLAESTLKKIYRLPHTQTPSGDRRIEFVEYLAPEGRLGYRCGSFCEMKMIVRELRLVLFRGAWSVDLRRCHTNALLGAYGRALGLGLVGNDATLDRMRADLPGVESELTEDQKRLLPEARARLERLRGSPGEENARKFVEYLHLEPKMLLSRMLNHPDNSPMFAPWPLAAACCKAFGAAAAAAKLHPLVVGDRFRPELMDKSDEPWRVKQQLAIIFERRSLLAMIATLESMGMTPSLTINDELLLFPPAGTDMDVVRSSLERAVADSLHFVAPVRLEQV